MNTDITMNQSPCSFQHSSIKMQRRIMYNFAFFSLKTLFDVWALICFFEEVDLELSMKSLLGWLSFSLFLHYLLTTKPLVPCLYLVTTEISSPRGISRGVTRGVVSVFLFEVKSVKLLLDISKCLEREWEWEWEIERETDSTELFCSQQGSWISAFKCGLLFLV